MSFPASFHATHFSHHRKREKEPAGADGKGKSDGSESGGTIGRSGVRALRFDIMEYNVVLFSMHSSLRAIFRIGVGCSDMRTSPSCRMLVL